MLRLPPLELVLYVAWAFVATVAVRFRGGSSTVCIKETIQLAGYFIIAALLFADVMRSPARLRAAAYVFLAGGTIVVVHALIQALRGPLFSLPSADAQHAVRAAFVNNHVLSAYLAMLAPMSMAILLYWPGFGVKAWAGLLLLASLLLVMNGGLLIVLVVSVVAVAAVCGKGDAGVVVLVLLLLLLFILPLFSKERGERLLGTISLYGKWMDPTGTRTNDILSFRYRRWNAGLNMFRMHPVVGVGPGLFQDNIGKQQYHVMADGTTPVEVYAEDVTIRKKFVDNRYVLTMAEMGLPGIMILVSVLIMSSLRALQVFLDVKDPKLKGLFLGCFGIVIAAALGGIFCDFLVRGLALPVVFAIAVSHARIYRPPDPKPEGWIPGVGG